MSSNDSKDRAKGDRMSRCAYVGKGQTDDLLLGELGRPRGWVSGGDYVTWVDPPSEGLDGWEPELVSLGLIIASRLKQARLRAGMSQTDAARATGLHVPTISQLERGRYDNPTIATLHRLALVYGVGLDWLTALSADSAP